MGAFGSPGIGPGFYSPGAIGGGGGTGPTDVTAAAVLTDNAVVLGSGGGRGVKSAAGLGTLGQVFTSNGAGLAPTFQDNPADGANQALSNLAAVALNTALLPDAAAADDFGSATLPFKDFFLAGSSGTPGTNNFRITGASTSGTRVITLPDATDTLVGLAASQVLTNKTLTSPVINTSVSGTAFLDDDTFATATATTFASAESIKAYVDAQVGGAGFDWHNEVVGTSQAMAVQNGYVANNAGLVTLTLPTTAAVGDVVAVQGVGAGGWLIAQNASEIIHVGNVASTAGVGGSVASINRYDSVTLVCVVADTEWAVIASQGSLTIV